MGLVAACYECGTFRYSGIAVTGCRVCDGAGFIIGGDRDGVSPIVVVRAAVMALGEGIDRERVLRAGLLGDKAVPADPNDVPWDMAARQRVGREAGALLRELGLRKSKPRKVTTPEERAAKKRENAAKAEQARVFAEQFERRQQERANERRRRKVEAEAMAALAAAHPEEFAEELETQTVFVALDEGFGSYMPPAVRRALGQS